MRTATSAPRAPGHPAFDPKCHLCVTSGGPCTAHELVAERASTKALKKRVRELEAEIAKLRGLQ